MAKKKSSKKTIPHQPNLLRLHRKTLNFNDKEHRLIENFCTKFKINNKSKFLREAIIRTILIQLEASQPTLF